MKRRRLYTGTSKLRNPSRKCPRCGGSAEGTTALGYADDMEPEPGLPVVCAYCGGLNIFTDALELRPLDRAERRKLLREQPHLRAPLKIAQQAVETVLARRKAEKAAWN